MRLAIVTPYPPSKGTLNEYAYHFVRKLREKDEISEVIILSDELPQGESYNSEAATPGLAALTIISCWRFDALDNALRINKVLREQRPDGVLFNIQFASFGQGKLAASMGLGAPRMAKMAGIPTIVLLHNIMETVDLKSAGFEMNPIMERMVRMAGTVATRLVLSADRVALTIPKYVEILHEKYGADNVLLAPHGTFDDDVELPDFDLPDGPKQIMAFGKFGTYKKVEIMVEAARILEERGYGPLEVVIAGTDSPNANGYLAGVKAAYPEMDNLVFTGYVEEEDVPRIFTEAAVAVFPYTSTTGSSGVLHQAGSYGKAAVLPRIGDFAEVISEEGYDGEFFEPDSAESMVTAIANVIGDDERRRELGMRNFLASKGLPIADVVDWYLFHFEMLMNEKGQAKSAVNSKTAPREVQSEQV